MGMKRALGTVGVNSHKQQNLGWEEEKQLLAVALRPRRIPRGVYRREGNKFIKGGEEW